MVKLVHFLTLGLVGSCVLFSLSLHALNLFLAQSAASLDAYFLFLARGLIFGRHVEDAVGVDIERYFNLWNTATSGSDTFEVELSDAFVLRSHRTFALQNVDGNSRLVVYCCRECFALLVRDGGVGVDKLGHYATHCLDTQRQRRNVEQHDVAHTALLVEDSTLNGSTYGYYFVGVNALRRLFAEVVLYQCLHGGDAARTSYEDNFVDIRCRQLGILYGVLAGDEASLYQVVCQLLELSAGQGLHQVLGYATLCRYIRQVNFCRRGARQLNLSFFGSLFQALHGHGVLR